MLKSLTKKPLGFPQKIKLSKIVKRDKTFRNIAEFDRTLANLI